MGCHFSLAKYTAWMQTWSLSERTCARVTMYPGSKAMHLVWRNSTLLQISYISKCNVAMHAQFLEGLTLFRYKPSVLSFFLSSPSSFSSIFLFLILLFLYFIYLRFLQDHWLSLTYSLYIMFFIVNCPFNMWRNKIVYPLNWHYFLLRLFYTRKYIQRDRKSHNWNVILKSIATFNLSTLFITFSLTYTRDLHEIFVVSHI